MREEYTFQEVIQRIEPEQIYKCVDTVFNVQEVSMDEIGIINIKHNKSTTSISPSQKFYLIQKPVDFIDAVNAFDNGKKIRCIRDNLDEFIYDGSNKSVLSDEEDCAVGSAEILCGKWYIED